MRETQSMFRCLQLEIGEDAGTDVIESEKRALPHVQEKIFDAARRCEDDTQVTQGSNKPISRMEFREMTHHRRR